MDSIKIRKLPMEQECKLDVKDSRMNKTNINTFAGDNLLVLREEFVAANIIADVTLEIYRNSGKL